MRKVEEQYQSDHKIINRHPVSRLMHKGPDSAKLSSRVARSGIKESTHLISAKQRLHAKILRLAALTQDDSFFME